MLAALCLMLRPQEGMQYSQSDWFTAGPTYTRGEPVTPQRFARASSPAALLQQCFHPVCWLYVRGFPPPSPLGANCNSCGG